MLGLSVADLAAACGVQERTVRRWEKPAGFQIPDSADFAIYEMREFFNAALDALQREVAEDDARFKDDQRVVSVAYYRTQDDLDLALESGLDACPADAEDVFGLGGSVPIGFRNAVARELYRRLDGAGRCVELDYVYRFEDEGCSLDERTVVLSQKYLHDRVRFLDAYEGMATDLLANLESGPCRFATPQKLYSEYCLLFYTVFGRKAPTECEYPDYRRAGESVRDYISRILGYDPVAGLAKGGLSFLLSRMDEDLSYWRRDVKDWLDGADALDNERIGILFKNVGLMDNLIESKTYDEEDVLNYFGYEDPKYFVPDRVSRIVIRDKIDAMVAEGQGAVFEESFPGGLAAVEDIFDSNRWLDHEWWDPTNCCDLDDWEPGAELYRYCDPVPWEQRRLVKVLTGYASPIEEKPECATLTGYWRYLCVHSLPEAAAAKAPDPEPEGSASPDGDHAVDQVHDADKAPANPTMFDEALSLYLQAMKEAGYKTNTIYTRRYLLKNKIGTSFSKENLLNIGKEVTDRYRENRALDGAKPRSIKNELDALYALVNFVRNGYSLSSSRGKDKPVA